MRILMRIRDSEFCQSWIRDEWNRVRDPGSGISIPEPQHCSFGPVTAGEGGGDLPEVDEGGPGMGLNPRVGRVVHEEQEAGHHARVELLLEDGREVRRHLANSVAAGVPHPTQTTIHYSYLLRRPPTPTSVSDPWNFGTDPDPRIHTTD